MYNMFLCVCNMWNRYKYYKIVYYIYQIRMKNSLYVWSGRIVTSIKIDDDGGVNDFENAIQNENNFIELNLVSWTHRISGQLTT